jgi:hypothetical protein
VAIVLCVLAACGGTLPLDALDAAATDGGGDVTVTAFDAGPDTTSLVDAHAEADATIATCPSGEVFCGGVCYPDDVDHCGANCTACPAPAFGTATCNGTSCGVTCDILQCGSACVDPSNDPKNCGTCNHDCGIEVCNQGVCTPDQLFPTVAPWGLGVDSKNLFWGTGSEVDQGPKTGGTWIAIAKPISMVVTTVVVDAKNVYWSEDYGVGVVPIGGGTITSLTSTTAQWPCIPGLGPDAIYLGDYANGSALWAVPYDGGPAVALEPTGDRINGAAYSAGNAYFADNQRVWRTSASIVDAGSEVFFTHDAGFANFPPFVMTDAGAAYVPMTDGVWAVPADGGTATNIAPNAPDVRWVTFDASYVYMASEAAIYREPIGDTTPAVLYVAPTPDIHALTIDDTYVYFSYAGNNSPGPGIYRIAK